MRLRLYDGVENIGPDITVFGIEHSNAGEIIRQLKIKVSVLAVKNRQGPGFFDQLHRLFNFAVREDLIALDIDLLDPHLRPFIYFESECDGIWRDVLGRRFDGGILMPLFGEHHFDDRFRFLDLARVVSRFLGDGRLLFSQLF